MLKTSALQKPWVAACVRVLLLPFNIYGDEFPQASVTQALTEFTGLISFCRPSKAIFDVSSPLPRLRRLVQIYDAHLPPSIAQYLTHLYLFGNIVHSASLILQMKATLECLTHILLVNAVGWPAGFVEVMDVLEPNVPHGLPKFLQVFVMFTGSDVNDMGNPEHNDLWRKARKVVDADPRIILWSSIGSKGAPDSWIGPRLCEYKTRGLMSECLGALSDGEQGIWEAVERWVLEAAKTPQA
ncbi:hypothetical protein DL96DRAFT_278478 [Flagelloscypha sp. PMI_526]|nr:hypothetical protein DL96DRAFT_278478 [Flagelloscypha sp. PMI_526]